MLVLIASFGSSILLSLSLIAVLVRSPLIKYFADQPNARKVHQRAIPRIGGLGIVVTFLLVLWGIHFPQAFSPYYKFKLSMTFASVFLIIAGTLDDVYSLGYRAKFLLQFLLAGIVVSVFHLQFEQFSFFGHLVPLRGMGIVISMFWIVAIVNAVNIIDGIDGLAAGVAISGLAGVGFLAYAGGLPNVVIICAILAGTIFGFLYFNFHNKHKIFLGDTGSQFLGAVLALLILRIHGTSGVAYSAAIPVLLVAYPVLDTSVAMARRFLKGRRNLDSRITRMFLADNQHLHHRLVYQGLSHTRATFLLVVLSSGFAASAVLLSRVGPKWSIAIAVYLFLVLVLVLGRLGFMDTKNSRKRISKNRISNSAALRATPDFTRTFPATEAPQREFDASAGKTHSSQIGAV